MRALPPENEMRQAFMARDASYDGLFYTAVRTTGIFCRPSCPAPKPKPQNIEFFASPSEALFSGYRACKRCRPLDANGRPPAWVERLLARLEKRPQQRIPARDLLSMGIDPARARRYFVKHYGMTFQAYCRARRLGEAFQRIKGGTTVTQAALTSGFESESGFRDAFARLFGAAPSAAKHGDVIALDWIESPVGPLIAAATEQSLCLLEFSDRRMLEAQLTVLKRRFGRPLAPGGNEVLRRTREQLHEYFARERREFDLPLEYPGTPFQMAVWATLRTIPYGETWSYRQLAAAVGRPGAVRAVGTANGMNRIAIIIPCHRVVNANGDLGGYGGGAWRKRLLLELESAQRLLAV